MHVPDLTLATGLERARHRAAEGALLSPVHAVFGLRVEAADAGSATGRSAASCWHLDAGGSPAAGTVALAADVALGAAMLTTLPAGRASVTSQLRIDFLAPVRCTDGRLVAHANVDDAGSPSPLISGAVFDADGVRVAAVSARCLAVVAVGEQLEASVVTGRTVLDAGGADAAERWRRHGGRPPLWEFLDATLHREGDLRRGGASVLTLPAAPSFANIFGAFHGGVTGLVVEQALVSAARGVASAGDVLQPVDLQLSYLRGVKADGDLLRCSAFVVRSGRQVVETRCELTDAAGVVAAVARAAFLRSAE